MTIEPGKGGWMFGFSLLMMPGLAEEGTGVKVKKEGTKKNEGGDKKGVGQILNSLKALMALCPNYFFSNFIL